MDRSVRLIVKKYARLANVNRTSTLIRCGTRLPRTCSPMAPTCELSKSFWAMPRFRPQNATPRQTSSSLRTCTTNHIRTLEIPCRAQDWIHRLLWGGKSGRLPRYVTDNESLCNETRSLIQVSGPRALRGADARQPPPNHPSWFRRSGRLGAANVPRNALLQDPGTA